MTILPKFNSISATLAATAPVLAFVAGLTAVHVLSPGTGAMQAGASDTNGRAQTHQARTAPPLPGDMQARRAGRLPAAFAHNVLPGTTGPTPTTATGSQ